jgi:Na+/H+ antiporter NhaD/arsenite permease-like protein
MLLQILPSLVNWLITTTFLNYCRTSKPGSLFYIRTNDSSTKHSKINQNEEGMGTDSNQIKILNKAITLKDAVPWVFLFMLIVLELSNMVSLVSLFSLTAIFCMIIVLLLEYYCYKINDNDKGSDALLMIEEYTESIFNSIDYNLLVIFIGLFICSGTLVETKLPEQLFYMISSDEPFTTSLSTFTASIYIVIMSQFVGNVPLVIMMINPINNIKDLILRKNAWLLLSYISTVAGNLTISGSAANVIVSEIANRHRLKVKIDAIFHFKLCFVVTIFNILFGSFIISLESNFF